MSITPNDLNTTSLGYGTTNLMKVATTGERVRLLETAYECGIRHFDTAPYYGYGEAERVLGDFAKRKREQITITTKFGIGPPAVVKFRVINHAARCLLRTFPFLRKSLSRSAQTLSKRGGFSPTEARRSLEQSLRALQTDYVDLYLLHEPSSSGAASEEMQQFLDDEVKSGRIRAYGCGGDFCAIKEIAAANLRTAKWLQFEDNVLNRQIEEIRGYGARCITFRAIFHALPLLLKWLEEEAGRYEEWERSLQLDLRSEGVLAGLLQAASQNRNKDGIVLFSTHRVDRIRSASKIAFSQVFALEQLQIFDQLTVDAIREPQSMAAS